MASEMVNSATSEKLAEMDWEKNIAICELVAGDQSQCKAVVKAIKKRLGSKHGNTQLYSVLLLEMLINNNIGDHVHKHVVDSGILPILVKIVKKKSELPVRERVFLLLDATQTSLGGKFPEYYAAYYDLVSSGVKFPERPPPSQAKPEAQEREKESIESNGNGKPPESSIIQKATNVYEVLKDVLDAVETQRSQGAKEEFTLDLVEQCSFQKQRVMHLVMASRDEKVVSRAIELNDQLQRLLTRHDALLSASPAWAEEEEEEEPEQLFRRLRKGKACARPEDEVPVIHRPLIRPLCLDGIPPPPAKQVEREKFFQENKALHSRNASSSRSDSIDSTD